MTTVELDNETTALLAEMAEQEHTTLAQRQPRYWPNALRKWRVELKAKAAQAINKPYE